MLTFVAKWLAPRMSVFIVVIIVICPPHFGAICVPAKWLAPLMISGVRPVIVIPTVGSASKLNLSVLRESEWSNHETRNSHEGYYKEAS